MVAGADRSLGHHFAKLIGRVYERNERRSAIVRRRPPHLLPEIISSTTTGTRLFFPLSRIFPRVKRAVRCCNPGVSSFSQRLRDNSG